MKKALILYLPVIHRGYVEFLRKHRDVEVVILIGQVWVKKLVSAFPEEISLRSLVRDPRCLETAVAVSLLRNVLPRSEIVIVDDLPDIWLQNMDEIIMPDEDVCHFIHSLNPEAFEGKEVVYESIFLRWDMPTTVANRPIESDFTIAFDDLQALGIEGVYERAFAEASKSPDWWRQVGGVLIREKQILMAGFNRHLPTLHEASFSGDPRSNFQAGQFIEFSVAIHAEAGLIGRAASGGICTKGLEIFTTTFPCPACAALIATSGLSRLYFVDGYSNVNALEILREYCVEIVRVT